ncbi:hypothetical protein [uncultured Flavobacterium sp.]|uniref:hypothetical protein n=1 Tax=uncultured Flavobacterium sp. TaxID=165435 RepID=UPI0025DB34EA|nr:hypothetical protein [uncultured Flavobacterium sp.]
MDPNQDKGIPPGWVGGFAQSNPKFAYPTPDLSSLPMLDNMANINLLQRQQAVKWPEFSWETEKGNADPKRCFQMFAPYISRLGYTDVGRIYSIICPQQGIYVKRIGCLNVEVTVTGQRGWADENNKEIAADMTVEGKIWFSPSAHQNPLVKMMWDFFAKSDLPFPSHKAHAIIVTTHKYQNPEEPIFPVRKGITNLFESPDFTLHYDEAWTVANIEVEIGPIKKLNIDPVDEFNQLIMDIFNLASGNMLQPGNLLSWNVWFTEPQLVDQQEWRTHAERWRKSIDEDHGSPDGNGTSPRFFDGTPFNAEEELIEEKLQEIFKWLLHNLVKH